jgi:hypothetical protein
LYRVWKGPGEIDDSDEEWVAVTKGSLQTARQLVDEGVHMEQLLDDLFPALDAEIGMENAHLNPNSREDGIGMVQEVCDVMEELAAVPESMTGQDEGNVEGNIGDNHEGFAADPDEYIFSEGQYLREACQPLYSGARSSMLTATLLLMNVCKAHGVSNKFVHELLALLHKHLLPLDNCLPPTMYVAKTLTSKVGLKYNNIDACVNGCVLFRKEHATLETCPKCGLARFKAYGKSNVAVKIVRHFPLVPRLLRMFRARKIVELMTWHSRNKSTDGKVRHVPDSKAWAHIDRTWPEFGGEPRNVRLGLATDGVNPFGEKSNAWSTSPVLFLNYNLPPWLVTKKLFLLLSMIIPGPNSVKSSNFDVYLAPVFEELVELWKGVRAVDVLQPIRRREFTMRAILMWTIHDFPLMG